MNRRDALKSIGLGAGYALATPTIMSLLQSCKGEPEFNPVFLDKTQGHALRHLVDLIIPSEQGVPGASEVGVHEFIDSFWGNVIEAEDKEMVKLGFKVFADNFKTMFDGKEMADGKAEDFDAMLAKYLKTTKEEQQGFYTKMGEFNQAYASDKTALPDPDAASFMLLSQLRGMSIWAWKNSEEVGENVLAYDPIPGQQIGCGDLQELTGGKAYSL